MPIGDAYNMHEILDKIATDEHAPPKGLRDVWYSRGGTAFRRFIGAVCYRLYRLFGEVTAVVLGLGIAGLWIATSVLDQQTTDLTVLRPNIKLWVAEAFDGHDAEFGRLEATWLPASDQLVVTVEDAEILGADGEVLEHFELIRTTLASDDGFFKRPRLINAEVKGGVLSYVEDEQGRITAGLGPPNAIGRVGPVYRSGEVTESSPSILTALKDLEFIQIDDAEVYIRSEISGIDLKSDIQSLRAAFSNQGVLSLAAEGTCDQSSGPIPFSLASVVDQDFENIKIRLKVQGARPDEIAPKKGRFWEFRGLAAPVNLTAEVDFSRQDGLRSAEVEMDVAKGSFTLLRQLEKRSYPLDSLIARAVLEPGEERMDINQLDLNSPNLSFNASGFLTELGMLSDGDENSSPVFNLSAHNIRANMTPRFSSETRVKQLNLIGYADFDRREVRINRGSMTLFDSTHQFSGGMRVSEQNQFRNVSFKSTMAGTLSPEELLLLWPVKAFEGARDWIKIAILDGQLTKIEAEVNLDESFFDAPALTADRFKLRFSGQDFDVKYMRLMPIATGVRGDGELIGNRLGVEFEGGNIKSVAIHGGNVEIPVILPFGGDVIINARGSGQVSGLMDVANSPRFKIASRYNIEPKDLIGQGDISLEVIRPLRSNVTREDIQYQIKGDFTGVAAPFKIGRFDIKNGAVAMEVTPERVLISGPIDIGPWRANASWEETIGDPSALTKYGVSGVFTAAVLDELGLGLRTWFDGAIDVDIRAEGRGKALSTAELDFDLTRSQLSLDRFWAKPEGEAARLMAQLKRRPDNGYIFENVQLSGRGLNVNGQVEISSKFKPSRIALSEVQIGRLIDGAVRILPDRQAGILGVDIDARYLDVSPWTENLFAERQSNFDVPIRLNGKVDTLVLDQDYIVTRSQFEFLNSGDVIESASLEALSDEKPLRLELATQADKKRNLSVEVPDASKAVAAFMGLNNTKGGSLKMSVSLPAAGEEGPITGEAEMRNFKVKEAPALAQLLSLASLTGLADTLTSGSMQFDRFKVPFTVLGDDIAIRDARLYGPALGMTADGDVDLDLRALDFDGTIVPAYTANSFLADIPLLGDLFVREKGGGLFALTYTVDGPFEKTQIAVNPLSALTPGFLRRIFKRDRSEVDDTILEAINDVAPPELETP